MNLVFKFFLFCSLLFIVLSFGYRSTPPKAVEAAVDYYKKNSKSFAASALSLQNAVQLIRNDKPVTIINAREGLKTCRIHYKKIEFFLAYFFPQASVVYNAAAKYEIEEPSLEFRDPVGLQVIEGLLYSKNVGSCKEELLRQAEVIVSSASDLNSLLYKFNANENQLLESIRLELIRVMALNISGYDAPFLKSGIAESYASLTSVEYCLKPFTHQNSKELDSVFLYLSGSFKFLQKPVSFDSFDRLAFLTEYALPLQRHLNKFIKQNNLGLNTAAALNYEAENLFTPDAINLRSFPNASQLPSNDLVELGRKLFSENMLSGNNKRNCTSCHQEQKYFTDGIPTSKTFNEDFSGNRNSPSLLYAAFQYSQFWDGSVTSLEEQVKHVIKNPIEMNADYAVVIKRLKGDNNYNNLFEQAFPTDTDSAISIDNIARSIAAYVRTLSPFNSAFDRYIGGDKSALSQQQKNGFNLFMGKAQCGTCHFAPLFNGLVPPLYNKTEMEVLGTPATDNFFKIRSDKDSGRFNAFPSKFYVGAFKTPSVRNAAVTAPYMHNGSFHTLEKVIEFYNKGGGVGFGLKVETQTLSSAPLNLNNQEIKEIVSFLNALTDTLQTSKQHLVKT